MISCVILAGGFAKRLKKITKKIPKSLVVVGNKPFIHHQISFLKKNGIRKIVLCLGHKSKEIENYIIKNKNFNIDIIFSHDGNKPLGTGGAIRKAMPHLDNTFFILYGDSYLQVNFKNVYNKFKKCNKLALMTIIKNKNNWDKSNIIYKNKNIIRYDKFNFSDNMEYIDYGLSIMTKKIFNKYKKNFEFDLSTVLSNLAFENQLENYVTKKRFYEIGSIEGLNATRKFLNVEKK